MMLELTYSFPNGLAWLHPGEFVAAPLDLVSGPFWYDDESRSLVLAVDAIEQTQIVVTDDPETYVELISVMEGEPFEVPMSIAEGQIAISNSWGETVLMIPVSSEASQLRGWLDYPGEAGRVVILVSEA